MDRIRWERLPHVRELAAAQAWLVEEALSGLSPVTLEAYSRAVERYLAYCRERRIRPMTATTEHVARYLDELARAGLRGATLRQRLTALRLFYAFVVESGDRPDNPVSDVARPSPTGSRNQQAIAESEPWIPSEAEWLDILRAARDARPRTRLMLAFAYEGALRRDELCRLRLADVDPARALLRVRDESSAHRRESPLSPVVAAWCVFYETAA